MKDYHDLYLKCDVLLLADIFEKFKYSSLNYGLCPSHYLSAATLSWDVMSNMTKLGLDLFQMLTSIYSLKKVWQAEFLLFPRDTAKPRISI